MWEKLKKAANAEIAKFVHGRELAFYIRSRRNHGIGLWAASRLGFQHDAVKYAKAIVDMGVGEPDDDRFLASLRQDLKKHGIILSEAAIRSELDRQAELALRELQARSIDPFLPI
jgi:hypothetical protein